MTSDVSGFSPQSPDRRTVDARLRQPLLALETPEALLAALPGSRFVSKLFDLRDLKENFLLINNSSFFACQILARPGQYFLVENGSPPALGGCSGLTIIGGRALPRALFYLLANSAASSEGLAGRAALETTSNLDFSVLGPGSCVSIRNLVSLGDVILGDRQVLKIDPQTTTLMGEVFLGKGASIEGLNGEALSHDRWRRTAEPPRGDDYEYATIFPEGPRASVLIVPRSLDFREGYPAELYLSDLIVAGDIFVRPDQTIIVVPSRFGRRASVLVRGAVKVGLGCPAPTLVGQRALHCMNRVGEVTPEPRETPGFFGGRGVG